MLRWNALKRTNILFTFTTTANIKNVVQIYIAIHCNLPLFVIWYHSVTWYKGNDLGYLGGCEIAAVRFASVCLLHNYFIAEIYLTNCCVAFWSNKCGENIWNSHLHILNFEPNFHEFITPWKHQRLSKYEILCVKHDSILGQGFFVWMGVGGGRVTWSTCIPAHKFSECTLPLMLVSH